LPILPLRDVVVYPHTVIPLFVGRERSVAALDQAMAAGREILLVAQTQPDIDEPGPKDIYEIGTVATILQLLKLPDGTVKVLVEGIKRARLRDLLVAESFTAEAQDLPEGDDYDPREMEVLTRSVMSRFEQYVKLNKKIPPEILTSLSGIDSPSRLADTLAAQMTLK
jgi:ATP-dependent Lon protease